MRLIDLHVDRFPDGHVHLKLTPEQLYTEDSVISAAITSFDDLFLIAQLKSIKPEIDTLYIDYLAAARCDRRFSKCEALDLKIVANFINSLGFKGVFIVKPHSEITLALIDNSHPVSYTRDLVDQCVLDNKLTDFSIISPDAGASKWVEKELGINNSIQCNKTRDEQTNEVISVKFSVTPKEDCIIVDDLCDGGRTFIDLAKELKAQGAKRVFLVVTHAIFSKGIDALHNIDHIYCLDTFSSLKNDKLTQLSMASYV